MGVDLGGGRAWSAAVAGLEERGASRPWPWHRVHRAMELQERRDRVTPGTYHEAHADAGVLVTDGDRRVPRPEVLLDLVIRHVASGADHL